MKKDPAESHLPLRAPRFACLGIRPNEVDLDPSGAVIVNRRGMSVSESWRTLQPQLIPEELDDGQNGACGKKMEVFVLGQNTGPFAEGPVAAGLELCFKPASTIAGEVCPVVTVPLAQYVADLEATRPDWVIDPS
jgi:hypothetical protein